MRLLDRLIRAAEARPFSPVQMFLAATWVAGVRFLGEKAFIYDAKPGPPQNDLGIILAWVAFYAALGFCIALVLTHLGKLTWRGACQLVSLGLTLAILPPLIDIGIYGRGEFFYRYQPDFFADTTFLLFNPREGLPVGEAVAVWLSILLTAIVVYKKTTSWKRAVFAGACVYGLGVFFGVLLPVIAKSIYTLPGSQRFGDKWLMAWVGLAILLAAYLGLRPQVLRKILWRLPQILLGPALVFLGAAWVGRVDILTALAALCFAGATLVFATTNLYYDRVEDQGRGDSAVVERDDVVALHTWALLLIVTLLRHHVFLALCLGLFLIASYAYHGDPLRIKCIFPLSYKSEGFFAATAFLAGILVQHTYRLNTADIVVALLVFGGFSLAAPFKDAKDVDGDREAGVQTLYVVLIKHGWTFARVHILAALFLAVCLTVPIVYLGCHGASVSRLVSTICLALLTVAATRLPNRKVGVALAVLSLDFYIAAAAIALSSTMA